MKKFMKKNWPSVIVAFALVLLSFAYYFMAESPDSSQKITNYKIDATFTEEGNMKVVESVTFKFSSTKHALFKDFVYQKNDVIGTNETNKNTSFASDSYMKVKNSNGQDLSGIQYGYSWKGNRDENNQLITCADGMPSKCESMFAYSRNGFPANVNFEYHYTITNVVTNYDNIAAFNWIFVDESKVSAANINLNITFENSLTNIQQNQFKENFYIHGNIAYDEIQVSSGGISVNFPSRKMSQLVEVRAGFDKNLTPNAPVNGSVTDGLSTLKKIETDITNNFNKEVEKYAILEMLKWISFIAFLAFLALGVYIAYIKYDREHKSNYEDEYNRELPADYTPAIMGYLYREEEVTRDDLSATLMDLIRKGYIELDLNGESTQEKTPNYRLVKVENQDLEKLEIHEKIVLNWFFEGISLDKSTVTLDEIEKFLKVEGQAQLYLNFNKQFVQTVVKNGRNEKFFDNVSDAPAKMFWVWIISFVAAMIELVILMNGITIAITILAAIIGLTIIYFSYLKHFKRRSIRGNEDYVRWKAFKKFLLEFSNIEDYTIPSIVIWEHYMVYAVAFGIADKVDKQLRLKFKKMNMDYVDATQNTSFMRFYYYSYFTHRIGLSMNIATNTISQARAARMASNAGKGGKGGFGGGRSFGGGGGGFRSR